MSQNGRTGNNMDKFQFMDVLGEKMESLKNRLIENTNITGKGYKVISKALINANECCVAYLSCIRNPQDESIDLIIDISFKKNTVFLDTDIYWSDGSFIEDLGSIEIPFEDSNNIKSSLEDYFNYLVDNELKKYSDFVIQQKTNRTENS